MDLIYINPMTIIKRIVCELDYLTNSKEIINNSFSSSKRIFNHHKKCFIELKEKYNTSIDKVSYSEDYNIITLKFTINRFKHTIIYKLHNYPFRVPEVILDGTEYWPCLTDKYLKMFNINDNCLCCQSFTCSRNWKGTLTMLDILLEYVRYEKQYFSRIREKNYCKIYICNKRLGFYLPISEFL